MRITGALHVHSVSLISKLVSNFKLNIYVALIRSDLKLFFEASCSEYSLSFKVHLRLLSADLFTVKYEVSALEWFWAKTTLKNYSAVAQIWTILYSKTCDCEEKKLLEKTCKSFIAVIEGRPTADCFYRKSAPLLLFKPLVAFVAFLAFLLPDWTASNARKRLEGRGKEGNRSPGMKVLKGFWQVEKNSLKKEEERCWLVRTSGEQHQSCGATTFLTHGWRSLEETKTKSDFCFRNCDALVWWPSRKSVTLTQWR